MTKGCFVSTWKRLAGVMMFVLASVCCCAQGNDDLDQAMAGYSSWWLSTQRTFHGWTGFKFIEQHWVHHPQRGLVLECIGIGARQQQGSSAGEMGHISLRFYRDAETGTWKHEPVDSLTNPELQLGIFKPSDIRRFFPDSPVAAANPTTDSGSAKPLMSGNSTDEKLKSGTYEVEAGGALLVWKIDINHDGTIKGMCNDSERLNGTFTGSVLRVRRACPGYEPPFQDYVGTRSGTLITGTFTGAGVSVNEKREWTLRLK